MKEYFEKAKAPLLINSCETDPTFPVEAQATADEMFGGGKFAPGYERTYWPGCTHGFAVRGDLVRLPNVWSSAQADYMRFAERPEGEGWEGGVIRGHHEVLQQV